MSDVYIPDPLEILDRQIDAMADSYIEGHCMSCGKRVGYELIQAYNHPAAPAVCYECLSPEMKIAYDEFEKGVNDGLRNCRTD